MPKRAATSAARRPSKEISSTIRRWRSGKLASSRREVYRCGGVHIDRCLQGVGIVVDVDMVAESTPAQVISQLVAGNRAKPRFERLRLVPGIALQMHGQQSLLNNILTIRRTSPRRCQAPSDDAPQPKRNMAEKAPIGLVVALSCQSHHCGEIVQASQRGRSFTYSCAKAKTLHAIFAAGRHGAVTKASKKPTLRHESAGSSQPNVAHARKKAIL